MSYRAPGYLVWNPDAGFPSVSHNSKAKAVEESERLAKLHPGQQFFVMQAAGVSMVEKPSIFRDFDTDLPF